MPYLSYAASITLLLFLSSLNLAYIWSHSHNSGPSYLGRDFPWTLPLPKPLDTILMTVEESRNYPLDGFASDPQWYGLTSASAGYVRLGLDNRLLVTTMFHELHCLRLLNLAFDPSGGVGEGHIQHCLGYLRQLALCSPDLTLERDDWEMKNFTAVPTGATHECRDWTAVYAIVDENYEEWKAVLNSTWNHS